MLLPHLASNPEKTKARHISAAPHPQISRLEVLSWEVVGKSERCSDFSRVSEGGDLYLTRVMILLREYNKLKRGKGVEGECKGMMIKIDHGI